MMKNRRTKKEKVEQAARISAGAAITAIGAGGIGAHQLGERDGQFADGKTEQQAEASRRIAMERLQLEDLYNRNRQSRGDCRKRPYDRGGVTEK